MLIDMTVNSFLLYIRTHHSPHTKNAVKMLNLEKISMFECVLFSPISNTKTGILLGGRERN